MEINEELMIACEIGDLFSVDKLINDGANINFIDDFGNTPLIIATISKHIEIIQYLVERAEVYTDNFIEFINHKNNYGTNALMFAVEFRDLIL